MRRALLALLLALGFTTSAPAQVSVSIGINVPVYPQLVRVPNYPVYYAPGLDANFFFYDGLYWVYDSDNWYSSAWYNGPWSVVAPAYVPVYVLRVPVRYYREPPVYFRGWRSDAPPRWGDHWGGDWARRHSGWDRWNRSAAPAPAPLPVYQRQYGGNRYPRAEQQRSLQVQNYRYQPRDAVVRQRVQQHQQQPAPPQAQRSANDGPQQRPAPPRADQQRPAPQQPATRPAPPRTRDDNNPRPAQAAERAPQARPERPQGRPAQPSPAAQQQAPAPRPAPPAAQPPQQRGPAPAAQGPQGRPAESQGRGQGGGQRQEREHGRGEGQGRGQDKKD